MYGRVLTSVEYRRAVELAPDNYIVLSNLAGASPPLLSRLISSLASSHLPPASSPLSPPPISHPAPLISRPPAPLHPPRARLQACAQLRHGWTEVLQPPHSEAVGRRRCSVLERRLGSLLEAGGVAASSHRLLAASSQLPCRESRHVILPVIYDTDDICNVCKPIIITA